MNPKERTDAATLWTRRHPSRNLKVREACPDAGLVDAEYGKVLGVNIARVVLVGDRHRAACQVVKALCMIGLCARPRTDVVRVIWFTNVASLGGGKVGCGSLVTGDFGSGRLACWEFKDVTVVGWVV